jgi:hypothetical protein
MKREEMKIEKVTVRFGYLLQLMDNGHQEK